MRSLEHRRACHRRKSSSCYRLFLAFIPLLPLKTSHLVAHPFSSSRQQYCFFYHSRPSPPFLSLSVWLNVCLYSSHLLNLPHKPSMPHPTPPRPLLPTASRPFPHFACRVPHECQAGIQGVCRRASLAGGAGASAGRMWCLDRVRVRTRNACCDDWMVLPCPFLTGARSAMSEGACDVLWRVECAHLFFFFFLPVLKCHLGSLVLIHSFIHGEHRELIFISLMHYFYILPGL